MTKLGASNFLLMNLGKEFRRMKHKGGNQDVSDQTENIIWLVWPYPLSASVGGSLKEEAWCM